MYDSALNPPVTKPQSLPVERQIWRGIIIALAGITIVFYGIYLYNSISFRNQPFLGVFINAQGQISAAAPSSETVWTGLEAGLTVGDTIVAINDEVIRDTNAPLSFARFEVPRALIENPIGETVQVAFERNITITAFNPTICSAQNGDIATCETAVQLMHLPDIDFLGFFIVPYASGILVFVIGAILLYFRHTKVEGLIGSAIAFLSAIFIGGLFDLGSNTIPILLWIIASCWLGGTMVTLTLIYPNRPRVMWKYPVVQYAPLAISTIVGLAVTVSALNSQQAEISDVLLIPVYFALTCLIIAGVILLTFQRPRSLTNTARRQADIITIGFLMVIGVGLFWLFNRFLIGFTGIALPISFETIMPMLLFPTGAIAFAQLQYRRVDTDLLISRSITYAILLVALILSVFLLALGTSIFTIDVFNANNNILGIALILFAAVMLFVPIRTRIQNRIDEIYYRTRRNYQNQVEEFGQLLVGNSDYNTISTEFVKRINDNLHPTALFIFTYSTETKEFVTPSKQTEVRFSENSPLIDLLKKTREALVFPPNIPIPTSLYTEQVRLRVLQAQVIAPLHGSTALNGFVVLSAPLSGKDSYSFEEVRFINLMSSQLAVGAERAQVIGSLERRVRELDVLSQVGQAVNFTLEYDDLLELVNTQTSKLIDAPTFYIALYDEASESANFAFFLEKDEREPLKEKERWLLDNGLFSEVIRTAKPMRVDNYAFEMDKRGARIGLETSQLRAWICVPLTAGRRTLGVMAVGKIKAADAFTDEQFKIFSDIGTLAATSLDKARLFNETKIRERQLTVLNDISRQLVATESDVEKLLQIILSSSIEILNCEAGALLLRAEDDSNFLEFRVVQGGAEELLGTRIDAKKGIAGEVVKTARALIANDVAQNKSNQMVSDDYKTQSMLAVPLIAKNVVIGVLEVLNKKDGTLFIQEDSDLLNTFAGQAAVAIENARLFRMTDLQLAQRVKELETLERIDNELNRTLDVKEVAQITVRSALTSLGAQAGALGIVHESPPYLEIIGIQGYTEEDYPKASEGLTWSLNEGIVRRVMRSRQPDLAVDVSIDPDYDKGLKGALSQITLPMFSGDDINAILILEKSNTPRFGLTDWAFSQRLAEHASIAIANAQLYAALMIANKSKSEFMGFAAHELKNPLSSVIGFADLMSKGVFGALNDQQQGFINTIHSNANRMQIIINDLRDSAKMDANEFSVNVEPMNVRHAVIETLRPFSNMMREKNQELVNLVGDDLPLVMGDETRIIQVLTNLVSNANKYSPPDTTVTVLATVINGFISVDGRKLGNVLRLSIKDEGLGISEEDQKKLFKERYFRSSNEVARAQPGTGLGMTLTYGIMQKHSGDIWVESELGKGSTFHIVLPLAPQEVQPFLREPTGD
jgi:signal transduction histidine kinase